MKPLSPAQRRAIELARIGWGRLIKYPEGWTHPGWRTGPQGTRTIQTLIAHGPGPQEFASTRTIQALVARGIGEYTNWNWVMVDMEMARLPSKKYAIEMRLTKLADAGVREE